MMATRTLLGIILAALSVAIAVPSALAQSGPRGEARIHVRRPR
jgi:hypothetical protein